MNIICGAYKFRQIMNQLRRKTGLGGFEPPASGLEARRYVQAKPQAQSDANNIRAGG